MCEICTHTPCHPRCPNAPDPPAIYECKYCGESIKQGEEFYKMDGDYYHEDCLACNALEILVDKIETEYGIAGDD